MANVTLKEIVNNTYVKAYIAAADCNFAAVGYKEHGARHARFASDTAMGILSSLGYSSRDIELAGIAGYIHDIGNAINMEEHSLSGAVMTKRILESMRMEPKETMAVVNAVGAHEDKEMIPNSHLTAAVIFGDKSDVHQARVRTEKFSELDTHSKVNLACEKSQLGIDSESKVIFLKLKIDDKIISIGEYFEIFLERMLHLKKAAKYFDHSFVLYINDKKFL